MLLESRLTSQNLPETAFSPFNHDRPAVQSAFAAGLRCSSIPIGRPVELAEVETGANQRPLRLHRLQATAEEASAAHDALDLSKDRLHRLAAQCVNGPPHLGPQLARHALLRGDVVRDPALGRAFRLRFLQSTRRGDEQLRAFLLQLRHLQLVMPVARIRGQRLGTIFDPGCFQGGRGCGLLA